MAIFIKTTNPDALLKKFKKAIDDKHIVTWVYDQDGDFTHATEQWKDLAWFRPKPTDSDLTMIILCPKNQAISTETYAIYHGRFIEAMLAHFDNSFSSASATALPSSGDIIEPRR